MTPPHDSVRLLPLTHAPVTNRNKVIGSLSWTCVDYFFFFLVCHWCPIWGKQTFVLRPQKKGTAARPLPSLYGTAACVRSIVAQMSGDYMWVMQRQKAKNKSKLPTPWAGEIAEQVKAFATQVPQLHSVRNPQ